MKKRLFSLTFVLALAVMGAQAPVSRADMSSSALDQVISYLSKSYSYYSSVKKIWDLLSGSSGPSLSQQLKDMQAAIIGEIQYWQLVDLDTAMKRALTTYQQILDNPTQTTSNQSRVSYLDGASDSNNALDTFIELETLLTDGRDWNRAYALAADFNTLSVIMGHAYSFHDKFFPNEAPIAWATWNDTFRRTIRDDYTLVGSAAHMCRPIGVDPGKGNYTPDFFDSYQTSALYQNKLGNKNFKVGSFSGQVTYNGGATSFSGNITYNPATGAYNGPPPVQSNTSAWSANVGGVACSYSTCKSAAKTAAINKAADIWLNDRNIYAMRTAMTKILNMGGGTTASPGNLAQGQFVDPYVYEPRCKTEGGYDSSAAYPTYP